MTGILVPVDQPLIPTVTTTSPKSYPDINNSFDVSGWAGCLVTFSNVGAAAKMYLAISHVSQNGQGPNFPGNPHDTTISSNPAASGGADVMNVYVPFLNSRAQFNVFAWSGGTPGGTQFLLQVTLTNRFAGMPMHTPNDVGRILLSLAASGGQTIQLPSYCGRVIFSHRQEPDPNVSIVQLNSTDPGTNVLRLMLEVIRNEGISTSQSNTDVREIWLPPWPCTITTINASENMCVTCGNP